jgi:hypothetical protein
MKKDTFYFPHDYNARNDVKCLFLRQQLGMEGYGIFWFLIESLADSNGILPLKIIPVLAMQMQVPDVKVSAVIKNFELFEVIDENFFSARLNNHLNMRQSLSEKGREGAIKRWNNSPPISDPNSPPIGDGNAKERKGNKIKGKESIVNPSVEIVRQYFTENGYSSEAADKFHKYYETENWHDSKGNRVKSWKQKAQSVWFKDENKIFFRQTPNINSFV